MKIDTQYIVCSCNSVEHTARIVCVDGDLYLEVQLNKTKTILQRLIAAAKYILGYDSKHGHWDITVLSKQEATKLYYFLKKYKEDIGA